MIQQLILVAVLSAVVAFSETSENVNKFKDSMMSPSQFQDGTIPYVYQGALAKKFAEAKQRTNNDEDYGVMSSLKDVAVSKLSLGYNIVYLGISKTYSVLNFVTSLLLSHLPQLIFGSVIALGICKLTPLCSEFSHMRPDDAIAFATPERLARTAKFVQVAIEKFSRLQNDEVLSVTREQAN